METPRTLQGFLDLVPSGNNTNPKFMAMVELLLTPLVLLRTRIDQFTQDYDLDQAIGAQLDVIGEWVGFSRFLAIPATNVWFSLDIDGLGLDEGALMGPFDSSTELVRLPDDIYRRLIRVKIRTNSWDGTLEQMQEIWQQLFDGYDVMTFIQDNQDMTMILGAFGRVDAVLSSVITNGLIPLKPSTVRINYMLGSDFPVFSLDTDTPLFAGLDAGFLTTGLT